MHAGRDIYDELQSQLAIPLRFEDWDRSAQRKGGNCGFLGPLTLGGR